MNESNYEYLIKQLKYSGFGEVFDEELREKMQAGDDKFSILRQTNVGKVTTVAELHFNRSKQGFYFFNKFDLALQAADGAKVRQNTFYNGKQNSYTHKEAYNLLQGRAVRKEKKNKSGEVYTTWDTLDLTERTRYGNYPVVSYPEAFGFDLDAELNKLPLRIGDQYDRKLLEESLMRGNMQHARLVLEDGEVANYYLQAVPRKRFVEVFNEEGILITNSVDYGREQAKKQEEKKAKTRL